MSACSVRYWIWESFGFGFGRSPKTKPFNFIVVGVEITRSSPHNGIGVEEDGFNGIPLLVATVYCSSVPNGKKIRETELCDLPFFLSRENATPEILGAHSVVKLVKTTLTALQKKLAFLILEHFLL